MPLDLTTVILNRNGAQTLSSCLESLAWCPQIILADDHSTDGSIKLAKQAGVRVISLTPTNSFAAKRNEALTAVETTWCLFIDVDEQVEAKLAQSIAKAISQETTTQGFYIKRDDVFMGKPLSYGETGNMWLLRLAKTSGGKWERSVHEVWKVKGKVGQIHSGRLLHYPHPSLESFFNKINLYTEYEVAERTHSSKFVPSAISYYLQLFFYPLAKFLRNYFVLQGMRDGFPGFCHAYCMSLHSLLVRIKMLEYIRKHKHESTSS